MLIKRDAIVACMALLSLTACTKQPLPGEDTDGMVEIKMNVGVADTKAPLMGSGFPIGTSDIGLFYMKEDGLTPYDANTSNMLMQLTGSNTTPVNYSWVYKANDGTTAIDALRFKGSEMVKLWGYYPRTITGVTPTAIPFNLRAKAGEQTDILYCPTQTITAENASSVPLVFRHAFAILEFNIKKKSNAVESKWITTGFSSSDQMMIAEGTINPTDGTITATRRVGTMSFVNATEIFLSESAYTTVRILAAPYSNASTITEIIFVFKNDDVSSPAVRIPFLPEYLTDGTSLKAGMKYSFNLLYLNDGAGTLELLDWSNSSLESDAGYASPTILEYGKAPFHLVKDVNYGQGSISYNGLYGSGYPTNGDYRDVDMIAYVYEKPYYKFEVAKTDAYTYNSADSENSKTWSQLQGVAADKSDNICVQTHGEGWRIPRLAELKLIQANRQEIEWTERFTPFYYDYWSATEQDDTKAWVVAMGNGLVTSFSKNIRTYSVRCIREIHSLPTIVEYGAAPFADKGAEMRNGSTGNSYNRSFNDMTYHTNTGDLFERERPYHRFEVANFDATRATDRWENSNSGCDEVHGAGWRVPRLIELRLMYENRHALNTSSKDFTPFSDDNYYSASEYSQDAIWVASLNYDNIERMSKVDQLNLRCIRELPLPPVIIEYGVAPYQAVEATMRGATKVSYNKWYGSYPKNLPYQGTQTDIYTKEPPYYKFEVAKADAYDNRIQSKDWLQLNGMIGPDDNFCARTHGVGWRLPRIAELRLMYENLGALNASGNGFVSLIVDEYAIHWSATEYNSGSAWSISFGFHGTLQSFIKSTTSNFFARCIREIP